MPWLLPPWRWPNPEPAPELTLAGLPMVIAYKIRPISAWLLRLMLKVRYVNLVNIIQDKPIIPEFLQEACTPENLTENLTALLNSPDLRKQQLQASLPAIHALRPRPPRLPQPKSRQGRNQRYRVK